MRLMVAVRELTGAGSLGLTIEPSGSFSVIGRKQPPLVVMLGSVMARRAKQLAARLPGGHDVERPAHLRRGAGEIDSHGAVADRDCDLDANAAVEVDAVIVEEVDGAVGALRNRAQRIARHRLGAVEQFGENRGQMIVAVGVGERREPPHPDRAGRNLRHQVALEGFGDAHIAPQDLQQRVVEDVAVAQFQRRQPDALLKNLRRIGRHRTGRHAADVLVVGHRGGERDRAAAREHRHHHGDVGQMRAAEIGVVHAVDVARRASPRSETRSRKRATQGISVARWIGIAIACASVSPCSVNRLADASSPSFTIGENELLQQRQLHLVGDAVELVAHHLDGDRIERLSRKRHRAPFNWTCVRARDCHARRRGRASPA